MTIEAALVALSTITTKWILTAIVGESLVGTLASSTADMVAQSFQDRRRQRAVLRQLEATEDVVYERMRAYFDARFSNLPENEAVAAISAVGDSLSSALTDKSIAFSSDLSAPILEARVKENSPNRESNAGLSDAATQFYDALLSESCVYLIEVLPTLPNFSSRAFSEILQREGELANRIEKLLAASAPPQVPSTWGQGSQTARFESKYLQAVANSADKLRLFGVETSRTAKKQYSLSVAYISLQVVARPTDESPTDPRTQRTERARRRLSMDPSALPVESSVPVEIALGASNRMLITGAAGSGKTTLLQWLMLNAARASFNGPLAALNGTVPILIPLRRYADRDLPRPEEFLETRAATLVGAMPEGWVHEVLTSSRALLLIDGLDELPAAKRREAHDWLGELMETFPDNRVFVTSRGASVTREWQNDRAFVKADLQPMEIVDIKAFVAHWYAAFQSATESDELAADLDVQQAHLLTTIQDRPQIQNLCTSPLLCALVCALHRDRGIGLPESRIALYETALKMLVSERDEQRQIDAARLPKLSYAEIEVLLCNIAYWLQDNGLADADRDAIESVIQRSMRTLSARDVTPEAMLDFLLQRTGVLRSPAPGRIDFVHRTFLEYLAAKACAQEDLMAKLVSQAHDDHWREVIILSAGHANTVQREALLRGLVERGRNVAPAARHRFFLLAVACMDTSPSLEPSTRDLLQACLAEVIPPNNVGEALSVAAAGPLAIPLLAIKPKRATEAAASVRALATIGGEASLSALRGYGSDPRVTVSRALIAAWPSFDPGRYAREVLKHSPLEDGRLAIKDPALLSHVKHLERCTQIFVDAPGRIPSLEELDSDPRVYGIYSSQSQRTTSLNGISRFTGLERLFMRSSHALVSLEGLPAESVWRWLDFEDCISLTDVRALQRVAEVESLNLAHTGMVDSGDFHGVGRNRDLTLGGPALQAISRPLVAKTMMLRFAPNLTDFSGLPGSENLEELALWSPCPRVLDLPSSLRSLDLISFDELEQIVGGVNLREITVGNSVEPRRAKSLAAQLPSLEKLELDVDVSHLLELQAADLPEGPFDLEITTYALGYDRRDGEALREVDGVMTGLGFEIRHQAEGFRAYGR